MDGITENIGIIQLEGVIAVKTHPMFMADVTQRLNSRFDYFTVSSILFLYNLYYTTSKNNTE